RRQMPALATALASGDWSGLDAISIDYGIMEHATDIACVPGDFGWNDVGSWSALADVRRADSHENVTQGEILAVDARRNIAVAGPGRVIALVGVDDLVVVQSDDAVLVVPRARAQDVREIVRLLAERRLDRFL